MTYFENPRSHVVMLNAVAIHPNFHGKRYGTQFLTELIELIKSDPSTQNITQIELAYEGDNPAARHFYEDKLGFVRKLNYDDWWTRLEPDFLKTYFWYSSERCCVLYLNTIPQAFDASHLVCNELSIPAPLSSEFELYHFPSNDRMRMPSTLKVIYYGHAVSLFETIIRKPNQTIYYLAVQNKGKHETKAMLAFRRYGDEPRLKHAATMPCLAFSYDLSTETLAAFIKSAVESYRTENSEVFHFSTSEEDTQENWYTESYPRLPILAKALQLAGFQFLGCFENYFNEKSLTGRHLLAFSSVFLGFKEAMQCLEKSKLPSRTQRQLVAILSEIQLPSTLSETEKPPTFSDRAKYEIYRIIRTFAYPQDYTHAEKRHLIEESCALLNLDSNIFIRVLEEQASQAQSDLFPTPKADHFETESEADSTTSLEYN